eukprot:gene10780-9084_t
MPTRAAVHRHAVPHRVAQQGGTASVRALSLSLSASLVAAGLWRAAVGRTQRAGERAAAVALSSWTASAAGRVTDRFGAYLRRPATAVREMHAIFSSLPGSGSKAWADGTARHIAAQYIRVLEGDGVTEIGLTNEEFPRD